MIKITVRCIIGDRSRIRHYLVVGEAERGGEEDEVERSRQTLLNIALWEDKLLTHERSLLHTHTHTHTHIHTHTHTHRLKTSAAS